MHEWSRGPGTGARLHDLVRTLPPGAFAMVMATGIVSIGLHSQHVDLLSRLLLAITAAAFVVLVLANGWRLVSHRDALAEDFTRPERGFGFYTFVAAGNVLAVRLAGQHFTIASVLLAVTACLWLLRGYALPWTTRLDPGANLAGSINGVWFMWAVGAQSIAVAAAVLARQRPHEVLSLIALTAWVVGVFLYFLCCVLVVIRAATQGIAATDLAPPYWIAMGAAAITSVAGSEVARLPPGPYGDIARELVRAGSVCAWILASWLVPMLLATGWWRHITHRIPFRYSTELWSIVFPLGMYAVASLTLARTDRLPWLHDVGVVGLDVAVVAWLVVLVMGLERLIRRLPTEPRPGPGRPLR